MINPIQDILLAHIELFATAINAQKVKALQYKLKSASYIPLLVLSTTTSFSER